MSEEQPPTDRELDPNVALGAVVKQLREQAKLGQGELAARAELSEQEVAEIEAGRLEPTWGDLRRISYALEVPLHELLALTERFEKRDR
ncbi:MAG: helix-turn-helix transcriptional regulator [Solirubrobacterales bacterium]